MSDHLDIHYKMVVKAITKNQVIPFLGPGVNVCGRPDDLAWSCHPYEYLPSCSELAEYLANQCFYSYDDRKCLLRVSQYYAVMQGSGPLYFALHNVFASNYPSTPAHRFLARLPKILRAKGYLHPTGTQAAAAAPGERAPKQDYLVKLHRTLDTRFDEGELRTLCFNLGVDYDSLPGAGKANKARELVSYLERRDRIGELAETGKRLRPDVSWPEQSPRTRALLRHQLLIVTTNYDDTLEHAFQATGEPFHRVSYVAEGEQRGKFLHWPPDGEVRPIERPNQYCGPLLDQCPVILKIHGAVDQEDAERDSFVITQDHHIDFLTGRDIANLIPVALLAKLKNSHILFLGYDPRDWNMRVILRRIWQERRLTKKSWAIQLNPDELSQRFWMKRDVDIIDMGLEDYTAALSERVQALPPAGGTS